MCSVLKKEFRLSNFSLNFEKPKCFTSPWTWSVVFVIYRFILAAYYSTAMMMASILPSLRGVYIRKGRLSSFDNMVYLTTWNLCIFLTHFIWAAAITIFTFIKQYCCEDQHNATTNDNNNQTPWYSKMSWLLANVVSSVTVVVTGVYFGAIHDSQKGVTFLDWNLHGLPTIFVVVDNFISARPVRLLHVIYPLIFGLVYVLFTVIFWAVDHENVIYPEVMDWNDPGKTFGVIIGLHVVIVLAHIIYFGLYRLQIFICEKFLRRRQTGDLKKNVFVPERSENLKNTNDV